MDVVSCTRDDDTEMGRETGYLLYYLLKNLAEGTYLTRAQCGVIVRMAKILFLVNDFLAPPIR